MENGDVTVSRLGELSSEYEILRELGRGGTAVVYLAREREVGRKVALKVIRATYVEDEDASARLVREARTVANLQHPNIVMLHGTRRLGDGSLALIMQFVEGITLKDAVRRAGPLPFHLAEQILSDIGSALAYAHRQRIVHRDIKPENIYLDWQYGLARLADFGIARPWEGDADLTLPGMAIGTPAYMSPEQIDGRQLDGRSDLYSLGLVGYEILTGNRPWDGHNLYSIIYHQKNSELPPLDEVRPGVPANIREALRAVLVKDRDRRLGSADEFLRLLSGGRQEPDIWEGALASLEAAGDRPREGVPADEAMTVLYRRPEQDAIDEEAASQELEPAARDPEAYARRQRDLSEWAGSVAGVEIEPAEAVGGVPLPPSPDAPAAGSAQAGEDETRTPDRLAGGPDTGERDAAEAGEHPELEEEVREPAEGLLAAIAPAATGAALDEGAPTGDEAEPPGDEAEPPRDEAEPPRDEAEPPRDEAEPPGDEAEDEDAWILPLRDQTVAPVPVPADAASGRRRRTAAALVGVIVLGSGVAWAVTGLTGEAESRQELAEAPAERTAPVADPREDASGPGPRPDQVATVEGDAQVGRPGERLPDPLRVRVEDETGRPVRGALVWFEVIAGGGRVQPRFALTDADGLAQTRWTVGNGTNEVVARVDRSQATARFRASTDVAALPLTDRPGAPVAALEPEEDAVGTEEGGGPDRAGADEDGGEAPSPPADRDEPPQPSAPAGNRTAAEGNRTAAEGNRTAGTAAAGGVRLAPRTVMALGGAHTCTLGAGGRVYCWGGNESGQLGTGGGGRQAAPTPVDVPAPMARLASGNGHTCALTAQGKAYCWGANRYGQLGDGSSLAQDAPVAVAGAASFTELVAGGEHTCGLTPAGQALCWGGNGYGQLGDGSGASRAIPSPTAGAVRFRSLTAGWTHTCGLTAEGRAFCWGRNDFGQLGAGAQGDRSTPVPVAGEMRFRQLSAGRAHTCGIGEDGRAYCWGQNTYGQLGGGTASLEVVPVPVDGVESLATVVAGVVHSCGLDSAGQAFCWGRNTHGQLGDGTTEDRSRPVPVAGSHRFTSLFASGSHTCGITTGGDRYCWGYNLEGQLGDGTRTNRARPSLIGTR